MPPSRVCSFIPLGKAGIQWNSQQTGGGRLSASVQNNVHTIRGAHPSSAYATEECAYRKQSAALLAFLKRSPWTHTALFDLSTHEQRGVRILKKVFHKTV